MKQIKPGFSLIELVIAAAVSSILALALYNAFSQTTQTVERIDRLINYDTQIPLIYNQLEKEISAAVVPGEPEKKEKKTDQATVPAAPKLDEKKEEKKPEQLKKVFYSTHEKDLLKLLTFITTTPLNIYNTVSPRLVRIVYRLEQEKTPGEPSFRLLRQESNNLDYKIFEGDEGKKIRSYEVVKGLKKFGITFLVLSGDQKEEAELQKFKTWAEEQQKKTKRTFPDYIEIEGSLWNAQKTRDKSFKFIFPILGREPEPQEEKKESKAEQKPAQAKTPAIPGSSGSTSTPLIPGQPPVTPPQNQGAGQPQAGAKS